MCTLMFPTAIHNQEYFACRGRFRSSMPRRDRDQDAASDISMSSRATSHEDINTETTNEAHSLTNDATDNHTIHDRGSDSAHQEGLMPVSQNKEAGSGILSTGQGQKFSPNLGLSTVHHRAK
ncbi:hypothetical protein AC579_4953 [Pseudocercospora musae]|uniref:Uncharacterized protein n=1 Tax=Pseudocercospora musae TaxID=113226 RepID=A0A139I6L2_9PEZI|nr:hypothetical protein AC579_4953 [Pseudocercospora musae]